jgi:hypothetical protein
MTWNESQHHRNADGEFSHGHVDAWARKVSDSWGRNFDVRALRFEAGRGDVPEGHGAAADRLYHLRRQPSLTGAEQVEVRNLDEAFATYRKTLGMEPFEHEAPHYGKGELHYIPGGRAVYNQFGERTEDDSITAEPPWSGQLGYKRVGEHPEARGRVGGQRSFRGLLSVHPEAGGVWIDPKRPGSKHAPRHVDDYGAWLPDLTPKEHPSQARKLDTAERRRGSLRGRSGDADPFYRIGRGLFREDTVGSGGFGYGARSEGGGEASAVFVARMKRIQPRTRQETARQPVRRTPRGTKVENWMQA